MLYVYYNYLALTRAVINGTRREVAVKRSLSLSLYTETLVGTKDDETRRVYIYRSGSKGAARNKLCIKKVRMANKLFLSLSLSAVWMLKTSHRVPPSPYFIIKSQRHSWNVLKQTFIYQFLPLPPTPWAIFIYLFF